jgi:hypothetical protein
MAFIKPLTLGHITTYLSKLLCLIQYNNLYYAINCKPNTKFTSVYLLQFHYYGLHETSHHGPHIKYTSINSSVSFITTTFIMPSVAGQILNLHQYTYFTFIITAFINLSPATYQIYLCILIWASLLWPSSNHVSWTTYEIYLNKPIFLIHYNNLYHTINCRPHTKYKSVYLFQNNYYGLHQRLQTHLLLFYCNNGLHERTSILHYTYNACVVIFHYVCVYIILFVNSYRGHAMVFHSGGPASIHGQTMWDLWGTICTRTTLCLWTSLFSCKYHSTKAS